MKFQNANELVKPFTHHQSRENYNYRDKNHKNDVISFENYSNQIKRNPAAVIEEHTAAPKEDDRPVDKEALKKIFHSPEKKFTFPTETTYVYPGEKVNKSPVGLSNRNVDQRKIQSNTKDIELDTNNNFVSERKFVILPTASPTQRTTLPNVYSNAGGNGMKMDDIQEFKGSSTIVRRKHRRRRKSR